MKKFVVCFIVVLMSTLAAFADDEREADRVKDAGVVLKEILNIPDDIPQDLLDKAEELLESAVATDAALWFAVAANTIKGSGALLLCTLWKVSASDSN